MNTTLKIKAKSIRIERCEGRHEECFARTVEGPDIWSKANSLLGTWARTAPAKGGYDKCDFRVTFEDGETYEGRYDLVHYSVQWPNLERHMLDFLRFHAGEWCPPHMTEERYRAFLAQAHWAEFQPKAKEFLAKYEVGGES